MFGGHIILTDYNAAAPSLLQIGRVSSWSTARRCGASSTQQTSGHMTVATTLCAK
jgi:hypothetical protein